MKVIHLFLLLAIFANFSCEKSKPVPDQNQNSVDIDTTRIIPPEEPRVPGYAVNARGNRAESMIAIDNVCAWPNLTQMHDGTIIAMIHNDPSHLRNPSDVECWASTDGGLTWKKRGTPAPRDNAKAGRANHAAGLAANGDLIVICSGWSDPDAKDRGHLLPVIVSRSSDGGYTWDIDRDAFLTPRPEQARSKVSPEGYLVPFGDICQGNDGTLRVGMYGGPAGVTFVYKSRDDGRTWGEPAVISHDKIILEPALFHLGDGKWLCAARNAGAQDDFGMDLYTSNDDGYTWTRQGGLVPSKRLPGHFLRLQDGRIVLSYGNRWEKSGGSVPRTVEVMISKDEGQTWSRPIRIAEFFRDGGYPSSVQRPDGGVVTAYYAREGLEHKEYHMGVVIWDPDQSGK